MIELIVVAIVVCLAVLNFAVVPAVGAIVRRRHEANSSMAGLAPAMAAADAYVSILLCRLVVQVGRVLGVDQLSLLVRDSNDARGLIAVAGRGVGEELIGLRLGPDEVSRRLGGGVVVPARTRSGREVVLCAPAEAVAGRDAPTARLLRDLAGACAQAVDNVASHPRPDPAVRVCAMLLLLIDESHRRDEPRGLSELTALTTRIGARLRLDAGAMIELMLAAGIYSLAAVDRPAAVRFATELQQPDAIFPVDPVAAADEFSGIPGLEVVTLIVGAIGERWDGRGHPHGIARERIPLASRILCACGAVTALAAAPPAGPGLPTEEALREIQAASGSRFDPTVVAALSDELIGEVPPLGDLVPSGEWARADAPYSVAGAAAEWAVQESNLQPWD